MYSLEDLIICFLVAIVLIIIFKLQRELTPSRYFSTGDIFEEIENSTSFKEIFLRFIIILSYGIILSYFISSQKIIILGMTFGSFLAVWPAFLSDSNIDERLLEKKLALRTFLFLHILLTFLLENLATFLYDLGKYIIFIYFGNFDIHRIIMLIGDSILWMILVMVVTFIYSKLKNILNKKIKIK